MRFVLRKKVLETDITHIADTFLLVLVHNGCERNLVSAYRKLGSYHYSGRLYRYRSAVCTKLLP